MRLFTAFTLLMICFTAVGQSFLKKKDSFYRVDTSFTKKDRRQKALTFYPGTYIDTEVEYTDSNGAVVIVQNSVPKGGSYTDPAGKNFGYRIFWTRVLNETATPLELTIGFSDSVALLSSSGAYLKLFLPSDTMTLAKETLYEYGATGVRSFLDTGLPKSAMLQRTINPKEAYVFYVGVLFTVDGYSDNRLLRAGLVLQENKLFYSIRGMNPQLDSALISCGLIVF